MTTTITDTISEVVMTPTIVDGYAGSSASTNVVHRILGGGIAITLRDGLPRRGTLRLIFADETDANDALAAHMDPHVFELADDDRFSIAMQYVVDGDVTIELDPETRGHWVVSVAYQAVSA